MAKDIPVIYFVPLLIKKKKNVHTGTYETHLKFQWDEQNQISSLSIEEEQGDLENTAIIF